MPKVDLPVPGEPEIKMSLGLSSTLGLYVKLRDLMPEKASTVEASATVNSSSTHG